MPRKYQKKPKPIECDTCKCKEAIYDVMNKYDISDEGVSNALDYFTCEGKGCINHEDTDDEKEKQE